MSNTILIVDDEEELRFLLNLIIEDAIEDVKIIQASSGNEAIEILKSNSQIELILSDYSMPQGSGGDLYNFVKENNPIPFFLISGGFIDDYKEFATFTEDNDLNQFIAKPFDDEILIESTLKALGQSQSTSPEYMSVIPKLYRHYLDSAPTAYIRLGEDKWVKAIDADVPLQEKTQQFEHFESNDKVKVLYLKKEERKDFFKNIQMELRKSLLRSADSKKKIETGSIAFTVSQEALKEVGVNEETVEFVEEVLGDLFSNELKKMDNNQVRLKEMFSKENYLSEHSLMSMFLCGGIIRELPSWDSPNNMKQLAIAAFFHDIELEDEKLAQVMLEQDFADLSQKEEETIRDHMKKAVGIIEKLGQQTQEAEKIVLEHHERPDGKGFPRKMVSSNISPLSSIFILAHDVTDYFFKHWPEQSQLLNFLVENEDLYNNGNFQKPYEVLINLIRNKNLA